MNLLFLVFCPYHFNTGIHIFKTNRLFPYKRFMKYNVCIYQPLPWSSCDTKSIFKQSLTGFNSEFSFFKSKAKKSSLPYLPIAGGRVVGFIPFPRVLALCEMQTVLSRIWTCIAVSISYDDSITLQHIHGTCNVLHFILPSITLSYFK